MLNTPTVFNAALSFRFNWEGDVRSLDYETEHILNSPDIMGTSVAEVIAKLSADPDVARQFHEAYGRPLDREALLDAISTYERSLLTPNSRFDRWLDGDVGALSADELAGYQLFKSLGCVSCHQGVNVGANLYQRHGIFYPLASPFPVVVRVPSLRNVAETPPYFHDGSARTLAEAVKQMGRAQLHRHLTDQQISLIVNFLRTLTGVYQSRPVGVYQSRPVAARPTGAQPMAAW